MFFIQIRAANTELLSLDVLESQRGSPDKHPLTPQLAGAQSAGEHRPKAALSPVLCWAPREPEKPLHAFCVLTALK